jgi:LysM repeat protein
MHQAQADQQVVLYIPNSALERMRRLAWARQRGLAVNFGDCTTLQYYTVGSGEYWTLLAQRFNLTVAELQAANPHIVGRRGVLHPGDRLLVPTGLPIMVSEPRTLYTVQVGDTWDQIASQFGLPLRLLQAVNPDRVRPYYILQPGDVLLIPNADTLALLQ